MATISFSENEKHIWVAAGWAFRQILDDVAAQHRDDSEMIDELEEAKAIKGLIVDQLQPELAAKITAAIRNVAVAILSGKIQSGIVQRRYGTDSTLREYRKGLEQLLNAIPG